MSTPFSVNGAVVFPRGLIVASLLLELFGLSAANSATSYASFRLIHRRGELGEDSVSYEERRALFEARKAQVISHNERNTSWQLALNQFADFTHSELRSRLGYKRDGGRWAEASDGSSFMQMGSSVAKSIDVTKLASSVDWRAQMKSGNFVHDQGGCGSCWAHAAVGALEAHADLHANLSVKLSTQEIIDCSENPRHCGGTGGCEGATSEIAFERARLHGIAEASSYNGGGGKCSRNRPAALKVQSFVRLPTNKATHLMHALATKGPVATSIAAENVFMYGNGVFSGCQPDTIVNHAVLTVGYAHDAPSGKDYWLIKNSWGPKWGERGYIRLERHIDDDAYCGIDTKPKEGVYCDDAPSSIRVCGMCGCTSDSTYPVVSSAAQAHLKDKVHRPRKAFDWHEALLKPPNVQSRSFLRGAHGDNLASAPRLVEVF